MDNIYLRHSLYAVLLSLLITMLRSYNDHWIERSDHAFSAELYLKSEVCQKAELKVQLGKWQRCAESKYELRVRPAVRALYDTLEIFDLRPQALRGTGTWFQQNKMFISGICKFQWLVSLRVLQVAAADEHGQ